MVWDSFLPKLFPYCSHRFTHEVRTRWSQFVGATNHREIRTYVKAVLHVRRGLSNVTLFERKDQTWAR
jgi:hypothetical protein